MHATMHPQARPGGNAKDHAGRTMCSRGIAIRDKTSTYRASHDHGGRAAAQLLDGAIAAVAIALWALW